MRCSTVLKIDQRHMKEEDSSLQDLKFKDGGVSHFLRLEARHKTDSFEFFDMFLF